MHIVIILSISAVIRNLNPEGCFFFFPVPCHLPAASPLPYRRRQRAHTLLDDAAPQGRAKPADVRLMGVRRHEEHTDQPPPRRALPPALGG